MDSLHPNARPAAEAALCAAKQGAEAFWHMHEHLFKTVGEWGGTENASELFKGYAAELGLNTAAFAACIESRETAEQVQAELEQGAAAGVGGTPAFFVNDWFVSGAQPYEVFQETIEAALRGEHPPPTPTPLPPGVTPFDPNPEQPGYTYAGDAFCGSEEAEITLAVFIDFQSPENRQYVLETWPEVEKEYVDTGKVRLMVKYFPSLDHVQGFTAAEAAECAGQQGDFCSMYDLLFEKQDEWSQLDDVTSTFKEYAAELDLDADAFAACLDEGQTVDKVMQDFTIGQQNQWPPAPVIWIIKGEQGGMVSLDQVQEAIEQLMAQ